MLPYFLITGFIALIAVVFPQQRPSFWAWILAYLAIVVFTGLRHHVGMDWNNYLTMAQIMQSSSYLDALKLAEPGYATLLWSSVTLGYGVYGANLIGAMIFCYGLFRVAYKALLPWLAIAVAMPFLVIVVSMSANRQTVAIGILMLLVSQWDTSSLKKRIFLTLLASMFHFSAIFFLTFVAWGIQLRPWLRLTLGISMVFATVVFLQYSGAGQYYDQMYVSGQTEQTYSPGATLHVLFNGIPAFAIFAGKKIRERALPSTVLVQMAWMAIALMPLSLVFSEVASRMTMYLFPVSIYALSSMPVLIEDKAGKVAARTFIGMLMVALLGFWLLFAYSSIAHIPYENILTVDPKNM